MENKDKYSLLTKEELFNLLEKKSGEDSDWNELDDFEKDAMEGFSENVSPIEAKKLIHDIDFEIAKKLNNTTVSSEDTDKKSPWLWLSLAASLALIVGLSILFLKNSSVPTEQNMALHEIEKKEINTVTTTAIEPLATNNEKSLVEEIDLKNFTKRGKEDEQLNEKNKLHETAKSEVNDEIVNNVAEGALSGNRLSIGDKEIAANEQDLAFETNKKAEIVSLDEKSVMADNQTEASMPSTTSEHKYNYDTDKLQVPSSAETEGVSTKALSKKSKDDISAENNSLNLVNNYYKGGENAIKKYVLNYEKGKTGTNKIIGNYVVSAIVKLDGSLTVTTINGNEVFKDFVKEALNTMKDWKPAEKDNKEIESTVNFKLVF